MHEILFWVIIGILVLEFLFEKYLDYLHNNNLPDWEIPNMKTKYYTTMMAFEKAASDK